MVLKGAALAAALLAFAAGQGSPLPVRVVMHTDLGEIEIEVDTVHAPVSAANFLRYVDGGLYDGGRFHRTVRPDNQGSKPVKIDVIQGAANQERTAEFYPAIPLERTSVTGLRHRDATVSMARTTPDSGTHEFFVCIGDQPSLDFGGARNPDGQGFAAFGRVVRGMDVVRRIQSAPAAGERLTPAVTIRSARRVGAQ
jgi:peptidyl-prolyl cis-trans isomerase A (cyclophilin A)